MQREEYTVGNWCVRWFELNRHKWNPRTGGGYRKLIQHHIIPGIGLVQLTELTEQLVTALQAGVSTCCYGGVWTKPVGMD